LKAAFEKHERETEEQVSRLEQVFDLLAKKPQGKNCPAILGIIEEGQEIMKEYKGSPALDAGRAVRSPVSRALRDFPLWDPDYPGRGARIEARRSRSQDHAGGGEENGSSSLSAG
jgi:hypothetical protein